MAQAVAGNPQHLIAFAKANRIRARRAELLHQVEAGDLPLADVIGDPAVATMQAVDLLAALPYPWLPPRTSGRRKQRHHHATVAAEALICRAGAFCTWRQVGQLTDRQRQVLCAEWEATCNAASR